MVSRNQIRARHYEFCDLLHHRHEECFYRLVIWPESMISDGKLDQLPGGREGSHAPPHYTNKHLLPRPWWWIFIFKCSFHQILFTGLENSKQKLNVTNALWGLWGSISISNDIADVNILWWLVSWVEKMAKAWLCIGGSMFYKHDHNPFESKTPK